MRGDVWTPAGNVSLNIEQQSILPPQLLTSNNLACLFPAFTWTWFAPRDNVSAPHRTTPLACMIASTLLSAATMYDFIMSHIYLSSSRSISQYLTSFRTALKMSSASNNLLAVATFFLDGCLCWCLLFQQFFFYCTWSTLPDNSPNLY